LTVHERNQVPLFLRQHLWEKLVSEWGMASLPPPGEG
jgi:hypothetical protein